MSLLGTFIDKVSGRSFSGAAALSTQAHSLGTTPDAVLVQLRSQNGSAAAILAEGANASLATVGHSTNTVSHADIFIIYFWAPTR